MLYIVATPIGNLKDITFRAVETLKAVDYIICEDTRTSLTLLNAYDIKKPLFSYHKFNEKEKVDKIILDLKEGKEIALISDAGMPCVSDPGNILVNACIENEIEYTCVSGASALINAFVLSGHSAPFTFIGFLPDKKSEMKKLLEDFKSSKSTLIFYVSPHSLEKTIADLYEILGDREFTAVREISKKFEEVVAGTLKEGYKGVIKGEFVLLIKPSKEKQEFDLTIEEQLEKYISSGMEKNEAIKKVAKERGLKKNDVYRLTIK